MSVITNENLQDTCCIFMCESSLSHDALVNCQAWKKTQRDRQSSRVDIEMVASIEEGEIIIATSRCFVCIASLSRKIVSNIHD